jgi:hypothetical protein
LEEDPVKIKVYRVMAVLTGLLFFVVLTSASAQEKDLIPLLDNIVQRADSYPEDVNWEYKVVTKYTEMDKKWQPAKTTITTAVVKDAEGILSARVIEAVEIEDGMTKDIIEETRERTEKQIQEANEQRNDVEAPPEREDTLDTLFPFQESKRANFRFSRLNDASINERPVFIIEAAAIEKDEQLFEGKFYIDQKTYDVLKAQIKPSDNPTFIKELDMDIDFEVLPEGYYIQKRSKTRVNGGPFFKRIRAIVEEEKSDIVILD